MIILIHSGDKRSREFLEKNDLKDVEIIDWYAEPEKQDAYMKAGYPSPNDFPFVVESLPSTGGLEEDYFAQSFESSLPEILEKIETKKQDREKEGAELPPLPPKPDVLGFIKECSTNPKLPLELISFLRVFTPEEFLNEEVRKGFWIRVINNPPGFLSNNQLQLISEIAEQHGIPLE